MNKDQSLFKLSKNIDFEPSFDSSPFF